MIIWNDTVYILFVHFLSKIDFIDHKFSVFSKETGKFRNICQSIALISRILDLWVSYCYSMMSG